jgi:large subunit ribosomal protein L31e
MSSKKPTGKATRSAIADVVAREYTIHLHKRVCDSEPGRERMADS